MHNIEDIQDIINKNIENLNFKLTPVELYEPISYIFSFGGKRIRPVLTLLACDLFDGQVEDALNPAIALEMFHNFTLIHDDIMDKAPMRRGKKTVYKKWNTDIAILSGDALFAKAYEVAIKTNEKYLKNVLKVLTKAAIDVCEGQQYDMNYETDKNITLPDYIEMIRLKTAALIGACLKTGAIIGNADDNEVAKMYNFGENLGLAFQLKDDLLDLFGKEEVFGKKTGGDVITNKKTYLYVKSFELATGNEKKILSNYFSGNEFDEEEKIKTVKSIYNNLNVIEITENEIDKFFKQSIKCLDEINLPSFRKSELKKLANQLLRRES